MRAFAYLASVLYVGLGAVMLTQAAYDPANVSASFVLLAAALIALGIYSGVRVIKNA